MNLCKKCVMPDTRPDIEFVDGVCSACIAHEKRKEIDWDARRKQLVDILSDLKPNGSGYDCIVPSSGGKDSHYQVKTLLDLGVKPLVVTATTCHLTDVGRRNIDNLARFATTIEYTSDKTLRRRLNRLGLERVGDISWPEHVAINTQPFRIAAALGIPTLFYGENPTKEYGGPLDVHEQTKMTKRWISEFGGQLGLRPSDIDEDMTDYQLPEQMPDLTAYWIGQFVPWSSRHNLRVALNMGMEQPMAYPGVWWAGENVDNAQTGIHDYMGYLKYGYNRASVQLSVDVRNKTIDREFALEKARKLDAKFPMTYAGVQLQDIVSPLGMSIRDLFKIMERFTNWTLFRRGGDDEMTFPARIY